MYCLRSYIPLLLLPIPLSLSPVHFTILLGITYFLNRPCLYCSILLLILFATSCHWSKTCLIDFSYIPTSEGGSGYATWFIPRIATLNETSTAHNSSTNETLSYLASALADTTLVGLTEVAARLKGNSVSTAASSSYVSSTFAAIRDAFRREWVLPCVGARVAL